jgi:microcystin-dependent protein
VLRDNTGTILNNKVVGLKVSILQGLASTKVYSEEFNVNSDNFGIINLEIGTGTVTYGNYESIDWSIEKNQLQTEIDINGGQSYTLVGTSPILSVPVANYAFKSGASSFPAGMIIAFAGDTSKIPNGWLLCDGRAVSRSIYSSLLEAIGLNWGIGNNISTFNVPDLRGQFLRGADLGAGVDPNVSNRTVKNSAVSDDSKVGTYQSFLNANHTHNGTTADNSQSITFDIGNTPRSCPMGNCNCNPGSNQIMSGDFCNTTPHNTTTQSHNHTFTTNSTGGAEARPVNAYVNYIIKY